MTDELQVADHAVPSLSRLYRLQFEAAQDGWVLLYPEGMVRLNGPAAEILRRCDGRTTVQALIGDLTLAFDGADLRDDVLAFLRDARERGWLVA